MIHFETAEERNRKNLAGVERNEGGENHHLHRSSQREEILVCEIFGDVVLAVVRGLN